jgi:hypothetical protein
MNGSVHEVEDDDFSLEGAHFEIAPARWTHENVPGSIPFGDWQCQRMAPFACPRSLSPATAYDKSLSLPGVCRHALNWTSLDEGL